LFFIIFCALLILSFSRTFAKIFSILLVFELLTAIANNIEKEKVILEVIIFFISFCFLLTIFIKLLILIFATYCIVELLLIFIFYIAILFLIIFIIILYNNLNFKVIVLFKLILYLYIIFMQILQK